MRRHFTQRAVLGVALAAIVSACAGSSPTPSPAADSLDGPELASALAGIQGSQIKQHMSVLADDALEGRGLGSAGLRRRARLRRDDGEVVRPRARRRTRRLPSARAAAKQRRRRRRQLHDGALAARRRRRSSTARTTCSARISCASEVSIDGCAGGLRRLRRQRPDARLRRLRGRRRREGQGGGVPERRAGDAPQQRARLLLVGGGEGGRGGRSAAPSARSASRRRTIRASAGMSASPPASKAATPGSTRRGTPIAAIRRCAGRRRSIIPASRRSSPARRKPPADGLRGRRQEHAAGVRPGDPRVARRRSSTHSDVESANLVARLEGSDPVLKDEHVVYIAHVDHFGRGVAMNGDDIYNGAHDNASGVAIVLEVAHAYSTLQTRPRRSVLFLFVTAEERGLLGSDYFARNPTVPRERHRRRPHARHAVPVPSAARHRAVRRAALDARRRR